MLDNIILLIGSSAEGQDDLINLLIKQAKAYLVLYLGLESYDTAYDSLIIKMVIEDWNRRGSEGIASRSFSGLSESYNTESAYSSIIMDALSTAKASLGGGIRFL